MEGEPLIRGQKNQGGTAGRALENRRAAGNRYFTSVGQVRTPLTGPGAATASLAGATPTPSCEAEGEQGPKGETGPVQRIWERVTSSQCRKWRRHEQGAIL